jgi:hypothetical protein
LNEPFQHPLKPKYGPIFPRVQWEKAFKQAASEDMYHLYYGASNLGKSVAITNALVNMKGIIYLRLHEATDSAVFDAFVLATNFSKQNDTFGKKF